MIKSIDRQYWRYHTPEALAQREIKVVHDRAFRTKKPYLECLREAVLLLYEDAQHAISEYKGVREHVFVEAVGTIVSQGLECTLATDDNDIVSENQLLGFVTSERREAYKHAKQTTERLCEVYNLLRERYTQL
ncbi:MAG: hypothetical protein AABX82_06040 [Nanoarchaeota archaeon]